MSVHHRITAEWGSVLDLRNEPIIVARIRYIQGGMDPPPSLLITKSQLERLGKHLTAPDGIGDEAVAVREKQSLPVPPLLARKGQVDEKAEQLERERVAQELTEAAVEALRNQARNKAVVDAKEELGIVAELHDLDTDDAEAVLIVASTKFSEAVIEDVAAVEVKYDESSRHVGWFGLSPVYVDPESE